MGRFLPCPLPCDSDRSQTNLPSDSSSTSSLTSQLSLPSVSSLEQATASAANYHCLATLKGHSSYLFSLAVAGKHLYSGASDGQIRAWDRNPSSHTCSSTVSQGYSAVKSIVVLRDKLITAHSDHRIRVWRSDNSVNIQKIKLTATLPTVNDRCMRLFSAKNYVQVRRHKKRTWVHHVDAVSALAVSADGALLYSVSWDRSMKVWRSSDFKCVESMQNAHDDAINAVVAAVDGHIYTGSADRLIKAWKKRDGEKRHSLVSTLDKHKSAVNALALSTDGNVLYSGACDRSIIVWEKSGGATSMAVAGALRGHRRSILCLAVVADLLCSGSGDRSVRVWRRGSGNSYSCLAVLEGHKSPVKCLIADIKKNDGQNSYLVYSGGLDFDIKVWQIWVPV